MTLVLTCPSVTCGDLNPAGVDRCRTCGKLLLPTSEKVRHRCPYCGVLTRGRTCASHRDLPAREMVA